jgi:membrane-associated phospholipid phosphatase
MPLRQRVIYVAACSALILGVYKLTQVFLADWAPTPVTVQLPGEENIPFLPGMVAFYLSIYLFAPALLFIVEQKRPFLRVVNMFLAAGAVHAAFFVLMPVKYVLRPDLPGPFDDWFLRALRWTYLMDSPYNCFPSMHVSFAFMTYFCVRAFKPEWGKYYAVIATGVAASTLFVKQHYVADVVAAVVLAWMLQRVYLSGMAEAEAVRESESLKS